jgi:hypothetical protein
MNKLTPLFALLLAAVCADAERYREGYADDRAAIVDLQARYVMAMDYFDADCYAAVFAEGAVLDCRRRHGSSAHLLDTVQQQRRPQQGGMDAVRLLV